MVQRAVLLPGGQRIRCLKKEPRSGMAEKEYLQVDDKMSSFFVNFNKEFGISFAF